MGNKEVSKFGIRTILAGLATGAMIFGTVTTCGAPAIAATTAAPTQPTASSFARVSDRLGRSASRPSAALSIPPSTRPPTIAAGEGIFRTSTETLAATKHIRPALVAPRRLIYS